MAFVCDGISLLSNRFSQSSSSSSSCVSPSFFFSVVTDETGGIDSLFDVWLRLDGGTYGSADGRAVLVFVGFGTGSAGSTSSVTVTGGDVGTGFGLSGFLLRRGGW